jgi:hypothetical protein
VTRQRVTNFISISLLVAAAAFCLWVATAAILFIVAFVLEFSPSPVPSPQSMPGRWLEAWVDYPTGWPAIPLMKTFGFRWPPLWVRLCLMVVNFGLWLTAVSIPVTTLVRVLMGKKPDANP